MPSGNPDEDKGFDLSSIEQLMQSSISDMSNKALIADSVFEADGQDAVAVPGAYNDLNAGTINSIIGKYNDIKSNLISSLVGNDDGHDVGLQKLISQNLMSHDEIQTVIDLALGKASGLNAVSRMAKDRVSGIVDRINKATGKVISGDGTAPLNSIISTVTENPLLNIDGSLEVLDEVGIDFTEIQSLANELNFLTGSNALNTYDAGAIIGGLSDKISRLLKHELYDVIDNVIFNSNDDSFNYAAKRALTYNIKNALRSSNIPTIRLFISKLGLAEVLSKVPNAGLVFIRYFRMPTGTKQSGYAGLRTEMKDLLSQLDSNWLVYNRNGTTIPSLKYFIEASRDAAILLKKDSDSNVKTAAYIGKDFELGKTTRKLKRTYPYMPVLN